MKDNTNKSLDNFQNFLTFLKDDSDNLNAALIDSSGFSLHKKNIYNAIISLKELNKNIKLSSKEEELKKVLQTLDISTVDSLENAMLTSYYTPNHLIEGITESIKTYVDKTYLKPIEILEPSAGSGRFLSSLSTFFPSSNIDAIEKDIITHKVLDNNIKYINNPKLKGYNTAYENVNLKKKYDLIISNIPFGNHGVFDKHLELEDYAFYKNEIHNFFFVKASKQINPGGLIAFITTKSFSDNLQSEALRSHLMQEFNLITALRFDNKTFKDSKTSVVSDLIILQKPIETKKTLTLSEEDYISYDNLIYDENEYRINRYFNTNPEHVLGDLNIGTINHGLLSLTVERTTNFTPDILKEKVFNIIDKELNNKGIKNINNSFVSENIDNIETEEIAKTNHDNILEKYPNIIPGNIIKLTDAFFRADVNPYHNQFLAAIPLSLKTEEKQFFNDLLPIRESYKTLIHYQRSSDLDNFLKEQSNLNNLYDQFNFYYGPINLERNRKLIYKDADVDLIVSLERQITPEKNIYDKSDIFSINTFEVKTKHTVNTLEQAIVSSFNKYGKIEANYITEAINKPYETWVLEALKKELAYINPVITDQREVVGLELALKNKLLSGYVDTKIRFLNSPQINFASQLEPFLTRDFTEKNIFLLNDVKPLQLNIDEINPSLGEPWIPVHLFSKFGVEHFKSTSFNIKHIATIDKFVVKGSYTSFASDTYSVSEGKHVPASKIFQYALDHNVPTFTKTIYNSEGNEIKVVNQKLITAVQLKVDKLNKAFITWIKEQPDTEKHLEHLYNYNYNSFVKENFDATQLDFDVKGLTPYDHQKNAAWQLAINNGGILDHKVGFGKSLSMAMAINTRLNLNITKKELVVGFNANYKHLYNDIINFFPDKKVLLVTPKELVPSKLNSTLYNIANNQYDVVVTAHSCLMKFPKAPEASLKIYDDLIKEANATLLDDEIGTSDLRNITKKLENLTAKHDYFTSIIDARKTSNFLLFEDLGIDHITIDESHYFKNLSFTTSHSRVKGLGSQKEVQKTANLLSYVRSVQLLHKGDKGVTFASGTTISNSLVELYNIFRYLTPNHFDQLNLHSFDQWAKVFCRKSQQYEETVGGSIKMTERIRDFTKVPELAAMYNRITHYADDRTFKINKPKLENSLISIDAYKEQQEYFDLIKKFYETKNTTLLDRVENTINNKKAAGLISVNHGRKASLDMRLINSEKYGDHPDNKINVMITNAVSIYQKFNKEKGVQLIFSDIGTPGTKGFNLYQAIKDNLIIKGVPANEIAFIHSYKNTKALFKEVNNGNIRFLIGSTQKMGVGVNVQNKLVAMHHLDFPWRPTDLEQRNGRGDRQGNTLLPKYDNVINAYYYAKKGSIDAYTFNVLQIKQAFIRQIKDASITTRTIHEGNINDDGTMDLESYVAACSNNVDFTEKLKLERTLVSFQNRFAAFNKNKQNSNYKLKTLDKTIATRTERIALFKLDKKVVDKKIKKTAFPFEFNFVKFESAANFSHFLKANVKQRFKSQDLSDIGTFYNDFKLIIQRKNSEIPLDKDNYKLLVEIPSGYKIGYKNNVLVKKDEVAGMYLFNALDKLENIIDTQESFLKDEVNQKNNLEILINETFDDLDKMNDVVKDIKVLEDKISKSKNVDNDQEDKDKGKNKGGMKM